MDFKYIVVAIIIYVAYKIFFSTASSNNNKPANNNINEYLNEKDQKIMELNNIILRQKQDIENQNDLIARYAEHTDIESEREIDFVLEKIINEYNNNDQELYAKFRTNVMFKYENHIRQIDHSIISSKGILIIENKKWNGKVFIGNDTIANNLYNLFSVEKDYQSVTPVYHVKYDKNQYGEKIICSTYSHNPFDQVRSTSRYLKDYVNKQFSGRNVVVNNILFFNNSESEIIIDDVTTNRYKNDAFTSLCIGEEQLKLKINEFLNKGATILNKDNVNEISNLFRVDFN